MECGIGNLGLTFTFNWDFCKIYIGTVYPGALGKKVLYNGLYTKKDSKTIGLGKYPLYFEIWLTYTLLSDLVNIYYTLDLVKYLFHREWYIYTL